MSKRAEKLPPPSVEKQETLPFFIKDAVRAGPFHSGAAAAAAQRKMTLDTPSVKWAIILATTMGQLSV